jgi:Histidine phosphatase superfamily (branch 2)
LFGEDFVLFLISSCYRTSFCFLSTHPLFYNKLLKTKSRTAHRVKLAKFSDYENDEQIEQTLQAMSYQTITHLSWRFRQWYQHKRLLAAIAAPVLREVVNQMKSVPYLTKNDQQRPFVIYSCHDVTILGILYALGAEFLADDDCSDWRYWPPYGSSLVLELVRIEKKDCNQRPSAMKSNHHKNIVDTSRRNDDDTDAYHVIRILLNGKPVITVDLEKTNKCKIPQYTGYGPQRMLRIMDFESIVSNLEREGGHDYKTLLGGEEQ